MDIGVDNFWGEKVQSTLVTGRCSGSFSLKKVHPQIIRHIQVAHFRNIYLDLPLLNWEAGEDDRSRSPM